MRFCAHGPDTEALWHCLPLFSCTVAHMRRTAGISPSTKSASSHRNSRCSIPGVATKLGASRVREMVFATAFVPPEGTAVVDTLAGPLAWYARRGAKTGKTGELPAAVASFAFVNGVPRTRRRYLLNRLCADSPCIATENVSRRDMPDDIPRTWILTTRDRALSVKSQRNSIAALGGVQTMFPMDTCHDLMISEPKRLAEILVERCRLYQ
jgi:hypothetical protein